MKNITFVNRLRNYTRNGKHKQSGLIGSIEHSLRLGHAITHAQNHEPQHSFKNKYLLVDESGVVRRVRADECKSELDSHIESVAPKTDKNAVEARSAIQTELSLIRCKFRKYKTNSNEEADFWKSISEAKDIEILNDFRKKFDAFDTARKNQKMKQIDKFIEVHKKLEKSPVQFKSGSHLKTIMQEQIFTIPSKYEVGLNEINVGEYAQFIIKFNNIISNNTVVKALMFHQDENKGNSGDYGLHAHVYVSGRCKDGSLNMLNEQKRRVELLCATHSPEMHKEFHDDFKLQVKMLQDKFNIDSQIEDISHKYLKHSYAREYSKLEGQLHGRLWQEAFKTTANRWLNKKDLNVAFHYDTRNNTEMVNDSKLTIKERRANGMNKKIEVENAKLKEEMNQYKDELETLKSRIGSKSDTLMNLDVSITTAILELSKFTILREKIFAMFDEFIQKISVNNSLKNDESELNSFADRTVNTIDEVNGFATAHENKAIASEIVKMAQEVDSRIGTSISEKLREKIKY